MDVATFRCGRRVAGRNVRTYDGRGWSILPWLFASRSIAQKELAVTGQV